jgi:plasmid maintenance system antidote protein VapI
MAVLNPVLDGVVVADLTIDRSGRVLHLRFVDGKRAAIPVADLPFGSPSASAARVSSDGSFVTLDGSDGAFDVTAHELAALAAGRKLMRPDLARRVGENLRAERTRRGLSLRALARVSGIAAPNLSNLENGHTSPRLETLGRLADVLGVSVASLVATDRDTAVYASGVGVSAAKR